MRNYVVLQQLWGDIYPALLHLRPPPREDYNDQWALYLEPKQNQ